MRFSTVASAFALSSTCHVVTAAPASGPREVQSLEPVHETSLITRRTEDAVLEKRLFGLSWQSLGATVGYLDMAFGAYTLVSSVFTIKDKCQNDDASTFDCFVGAMDIVAATYCGAYSAAQGIANDEKRSLDGTPIYSTINVTRQDQTMLIHGHVPSTGTSLRDAAANLSSNVSTTWQHIATAELPSGSKRHVMYRLAHPDDLGSSNDGTYGHIRVQSPASSASTGDSTSLRSRQDEGSSDGLIVDYIYNNNNEDYWADFSELNPDVLGSSVAEWMEQNNAEASCFVPGGTDETNHANLGEFGIDHGVVAYGWNGAGFDFQGNAQNWVDNCQDDLRSGYD